MNNKNIYIIASTFYADLSSNLINAAQDVVKDVLDTNTLNVITVPGAFEIPGMVKKIIDNKNPDLIITLGVLIKGETAHFEYISNAVSNSISMLTIQSDIPIIFGIITAYDKKQAIARSSSDLNNKGYEAMETGLKMLDLYDKYSK